MTRPSHRSLFLLLGVALFSGPVRGEEAPAAAKAPERIRVGTLGIATGQDGALAQVMPGGAGAAAGLLVGDKILTVDGKPAATTEALREVLKGAVDREVVIKIQRKDQEMELKATPKGRSMDIPSLAEDFKAVRTASRGAKDEDAANLFRKFVSDHPGTDFGVIAGVLAIRFDVKGGKMTPESYLAAVEAWFKAVPPEHDFSNGEFSALTEDYGTVSGGKDPKAWLAFLDKLAASTQEASSRAACKQASAQAIKEAADMEYEAKVLAKGQPAPDFKVPTLDGKGEVCLSALKGKPVLVDAWASWCGPCKAALPKLLAIHQEYSAKGLQVVSLSLDTPQKKDAAIQEVEKLKLPWAQGWDSAAFEGQYAKAYLVHAIPNYLLVDAEGRIVGHWVGFKEDEIRTAIAALFPAETAPAKP